jgi:hypothetical protein
MEEANTELSSEAVRPTKLTKSGKPRKQLDPASLEKLAKARAKANAIRKDMAMQKLEEKTQTMKEDLKSIGMIEKEEEQQECPAEKEDNHTEELPQEEEVEIVKEKIVKEKPKAKSKKKTKIIVEQSSSDSDEFEPNDNVVFVKRVSRKKKDPAPEPPPVERQEGMQMPMPPEPPPKPPPRQLTPQEIAIRNNYNNMFSGAFLNNRRSYY